MPENSDFNEPHEEDFDGVLYADEDEDELNTVDDFVDDLSEEQDFWMEDMEEEWEEDPIRADQDYFEEEFDLSRPG